MKKSVLLFLTTVAVLLAVSCKAAALKQTSQQTAEDYQTKELEYSNNGDYDRLDKGQEMPLNKIAPRRSAFFQEETGRATVLNEPLTY